MNWKLLKTSTNALYIGTWDFGKTFGGSEKLMQLNEHMNIVICQKSKIKDWVEHFEEHYTSTIVYDLTNKKDFLNFLLYTDVKLFNVIGVINYELAFRRPELLKLTDFTLMLDESSLIQNEQAKRSKFILKMKPKNIILLSGTPTAGRYERLLSQIHLLGWNISKDLFYKQYIDFHYDDKNGFPIMIVDGYKNVERLKTKLREHGCRFLKTDEVFDLPEQIFNTIKVETTKEYKKFKKDRIVTLDDKELVGDTTLTKMLYERMLCGSYNADKLEALKDLIESTEDRLIIFYNFNEEARLIVDICEEFNKPYSVINGQGKDLTNYENFENSITLIQYQAGSMGLNLQKANKIVYFTPPLSSELFEQSKKRVHRIGQGRSCFYYQLICKNSIEEKIYKNLEMRRDYTNDLFEMEED